MWGNIILVAEALLGLAALLSVSNVKRTVGGTADRPPLSGPIGMLV